MQSRLPTPKQSGFSVIEVLLIVLVVAVLAATGIVVYQRHRPGNAATGSTQTTTQPMSTATTQPAQTATQYLTINEWGIKLPLSRAISDANYVVATNSTDTMWLGLTSLDSTSCAASHANIGGADYPIGALIRVLPTDHEPVKGTLYTQLYPGAIVGGYYYAYISGIKGKTCAPQATLQAIDTAFVTAAKGIVAAADSNYLVIKEWGIKIKLAVADKITYTIGGTPNGSSANADGIVSWATLKLNSSVITSDKCRLLGYEVEQLTAATNAAKIGRYDYGFSGVSPDPCGDSTVDTLRAKISGTELVNSAITAE